MLKQIKRDEGFRARPYLCPADKWTIGYGTTYLFTGHGFRPVTHDTLEVTHYLADLLMVTAVNKAIGEAQAFVSNFNTLSSVRQCVLTMMAYQLGGDGLNQFVKTKQFIENEQFVDASIEMLDSKWHKIDSTARAERTADIFYMDAWQ